MNNSCRAATWGKVIVLLAATGVTAHASDGHLEINQTCAVETGCFPGDDPDFPVTIASSGSYRLTSNLDLSALSPATTAVQIEVPAVHLNLAGFEIVGATTCSGSGAAITCNPIGAGKGVEFFSTSVGSSVRNGAVRGFNNGISANPEGLRISDVTTMHNSNDGISSAASAVINNSVAMQNGGDGFDGDAGSVFRGLMAMGNGINGIEIDGPGGLAESCVSRGNGADGFWLAAGASARGVAASNNADDGIQLVGAGATVEYATVTGNNDNGIEATDGSAVKFVSAVSNSGAGFVLGVGSGFGANVSNGNGQDDDCGGGVCTPERRYYLSLAGVSGGQVLNVCDDGFHTAALFEIWDTTALVYDGKRGRTADDSGAGPPTNRWGWVRVGNNDSLSDPSIFIDEYDAGLMNCNVWTSTTPGDQGSIVRPHPVFNFGVGSGGGNSRWYADPWETDWGDCAGVRPVWCVEDPK